MRMISIEMVMIIIIEMHHGGRQVHAPSGCKSASFFQWFFEGVICSDLRWFARVLQCFLKVGRLWFAVICRVQISCKSAQISASKRVEKHDSDLQWFAADLHLDLQLICAWILGSMVKLFAHILLGLLLYNRTYQQIASFGWFWRAPVVLASFGGF